MSQSDSDSNQYERAVIELHDVVSEFAHIDSKKVVCQRTIEAAERLLKFDFSIVAIEEDGFLQPKAVSSGLSPEDFDVMSIHEGIAGKTYRTQESYLIDDITNFPEAKPQGKWLSAISLPIGNHGTFQAVDSEKAAFDEEDLQLAELLITHAANHVDRILDRQELERQNSRLDEFASLVSHDLRNPLNVAELRLELARKECESDHLNEVEKSHQRMWALINDILTLTQEENSTHTYESFELDRIATEAWSNVETSGATLVTNVEHAILADENSLKRLFENLFRNAIEHNTESVTVSIGNLADGFYVEDNGDGIPEDKWTVVFDAGYSSSKTGTGLGLRIVKQICETHDWQIHVTEGSDGGARFEITDVEFENHPRSCEGDC